MNKSTLTYSLLLLLIAACGSKQQTIKPTVEPIVEAVYASGIVKSDNQYQVYATVNGIIEQWYVQEGDSVFIGTPLVRLSNEVSKLNVENAQLAASYNDYKSNESKLKELKLSVEFAKQKYLNDSLLHLRQESLWKQQIGSQVDYEQRLLAFQNSKTAHESAVLKYGDLKKQLSFASQQSKTNLQLSQKQAGDFTIKSEVSGKVYTRLREKGELASPQTPLAIVGDAGLFVLELQVDEYDIVRIQKGQQVWITLDSYKGKTFEASVTQIYPYMNERTKSFKVEARFLNQPPVLYPNLTVEANIVIESKQQALTIPRNYITDAGYVVSSNGDSIRVTTGLKDYQKIEILSGITAEQELVKP